MAIQTFCGKCKKTAAVLYDKETKKTHCGSCDAEVTINKFMADRLPELRQLRGRRAGKGSGEETPFDLYCELCKVKTTPKLVGKKLVCLCGGGYAKINPIVYNFTVDKMIEKKKEEEQESRADSSGNRFLGHVNYDRKK